MSPMNENKVYTEKETPIRDIVLQYTRFWFLFLLGIIIAVVGATIYLRYTTTTYSTKATIIIKDEKSGGGPAELAAFSGLGGFLSKFESNKIENELAIFKSKRIIKGAAKALNLNVSYESVGTIKTSELYAYKPFIVEYLTFEGEDDNPKVPKLFFEVLSRTNYKVKNELGTIEGTYDFGEKVALPFGEITVIPVLDDLEKFDSFKGRAVAVTYRDLDKLAFSFQKRVSVVNQISNSNVVILSMETAVPQKAEDFLNELVFQYNTDAINDRGQVAKKTSDFIDSRLAIITRELDSVESNKEQFKSSNRLTNIEAQAQIVLESASEFDKRQFNVNTQLELANTMIDYMQNSSTNDLLPSNIGLEREDVSKSVENYNELILQRNRLLKSSTTKNPVVANVNDQIEEIRANILSSLQNTTNALKVSLRDLNYQESTLNSKLSQVPTKEKIYRGIERQQSIKEQLYLFLLQQREEASISLAVTAPKAKIVDSAYSSNSPVSPKKPLIYLGALMLGVIVPFLFIYLRSLFNNKIRNRADVEKEIRGVNIIGEVPKLKKGEEELVGLNDRSFLAESFRILRTNIQFILGVKNTGDSQGKTLFVTSTVKGEGKTFVAFNLALTLALTGKKVVLVGADIRNPQLHRYLSSGSRDKKGLTEFIMDPDLNTNHLAEKSKHNDNLDIILSGIIPPNPAELLMTDRAGAFFEELKNEYDYVVVDSAPAMLVTDTMVINKVADMTIYVMRADYTEKRLLEFPKDASNDGRLVNVSVVLNGVSMNNFGYGNKYGYSYVEEEKSWRERFFGI